MNCQRILLRQSRPGTAVLATLLILATLACARAQTLVQTFSVTERFGISHPDQIIDFSLNTPINPGNCYMVGPDGSEVVFQVLSGNRIAVRTSLAAGATRTWNLYSGRAPAATTPNATIVTQSAGAYEIVNGLTGVRLVNPAAPGSPSLAPIQGIQLRDGRWTATGPNKLYAWSGDAALDNQPLLATNAPGVSLIESGPLKIVVEVTYSYDRPDWNINNGVQLLDVNLAADTVTLDPYHYLDRSFIEGRPVEFHTSGTGVIPAPLRTGTVYYAIPVIGDTFQFSATPNGPPIDLTGPATLASGSATLSRVYPGGAGFYRSTIELQAGQPSILIEEDTDMNFRYFLDTYPEVQATQGRYRGHGSTSVASGYQADGKQYSPPARGAGWDAFRDFQYSTPVLWALSGGSTSVFPAMFAWDPWATDTGWYWMFYNKSGVGSAPVVGAFVGKASRALGCNATGPSLYTAPANSSALPEDIRSRTQGGITFQTHRANPDSRVYPRSRVHWGIFVGTKAGDLADPAQVQNIGRQMNLHGGLNLNKVYRYASDFPDSTAGYGRLFMEPEILQGMIARLRQDTSGPYGGGYYQYLYQAEPSARPLIDLWADTTGQKNRGVVQTVTLLASNMLQDLVNGNGIYGDYKYWQGGVAMSEQGLFIDSVLALPSTTTSDRTLTKTAAGLFANLLWDGDFVPLNFQENGLNAGTANMPVQMQGYANFYVLLLPEHPLLKAKVDQVIADIVATPARIINPYGAEIGAPSYLSASMGPTLNTLLQVRMTGRIDPFATEPRLAKFAEFYLQLLTPGEARYGIKRKIIAGGDGSTQGTYLTGPLATGFRTANPNLSARLTGAWNQGGKVHNGVLVSSLVEIDENAPSLDPKLGDGNFPGYMSVLRNGWGTPNETVAWLFNGDFLSDHRNDDRGSVVLYAVGAPLSVSWGSVYYPQASGANMKSMVLPLANFSTWNQNNQPLNIASGWSSSTSDRFGSFTNSAFANARMANTAGLLWTRTTHSIHPNESLPIIYVRDEFAGVNPTQAKVVTFDLMADGAVSTPGGAITPPRRTYDYDGTLRELPSASGTFNLPAGLNRLGFVGQTWNAHPTRGIDWDLYTLSAETLSANLGNWAHTWNPAQEESEFRTANGVAFEERQHILRIKGSGTFRTFILPWRKGEKPAALQVSGSGTQLTIRHAGQLTIIDDNYYVYTNLQKRVLTTFSTNAASAFGFTVSGGPTELVLQNDRAYITSHGGRARRVLNCPPDWTVARLAGQALPPTVPLNPINIDYSGDQPQTVILE